MTERWTPAYDRLFDPEHHLAGDPACRRWAWIDLCHMAQWRAGTRIVNGTIVELGAGELLASIRYLAERWLWSKDKVRRYLQLLEDPRIGKIATVTTTPVGTVYRIASYDTYANPRDSNEHTDGYDSGSGAGQGRDTNGSGAGQRTTGSNKEQKVASGGTREPTKGKRSRSTRLPDSWQPNDTHAEYAAEHRLDLDAEAGKFRDHAKANGRTLKDWDAGFRMWLRKALEFKASRSRAPDFGDETERDRRRAAEARSRSIDRTAEELRRSEEETNLAREQAWSWYRALGPEEKEPVEEDARKRVETMRSSGVPISDTSRRMALLEAIQRHMPAEGEAVA